MTPLRLAAQTLSPELIVSRGETTFQSPSLTAGAAFDGGFVLLTIDRLSSANAARAVFLAADGGLQGRSPRGVLLEPAAPPAMQLTSAGCGFTQCAVVLADETGATSLRRFDFTGQLLDPARIALGGPGTGGQVLYASDTAVVVTASGGLVVRFVTGSTLGPVLSLNSTPVSQPSAACQPSGQCLAAWLQPASIRARFFDTAGGLGNEVVVSNNPPNLEGVAVAASGARFVVAWRNGVGELRLRTWGPGGASAGPERSLRVAASGGINLPTIAWLDTRFRAIWSEGTITTNWVNDFDEFGVPVLAEQQLALTSRLGRALLTPSTMVVSADDGVQPATWVVDVASARQVSGPAPLSARSLGGFVTPSGLGAATLSETETPGVGLVRIWTLQGANFAPLATLGTASLATRSAGAGVACQGSVCLMAWPGQPDAGFGLQVQRFQAAGLIDSSPQRPASSPTQDVRVARAPTGFLLAGASGSYLWTWPVPTGVPTGVRVTFEGGSSAFRASVTSPNSAGVSLASGEIDLDPPVRSVFALAPAGSPALISELVSSSFFHPVRAAAHRDVFVIPAREPPPIERLIVETRTADGGVVASAPLTNSTVIDALAVSDGVNVMVAWVARSPGTHTLEARALDVSLQPVGPAFTVTSAERLANVDATPVGDGRFLLTYDRYEPMTGTLQSAARFISVSLAGLRFDGTACGLGSECLSGRCLSLTCAPRGDGGLDAGSIPDAGVVDGGVSTPDAGVVDGGVSTPDAGVVDGGVSTPDAGIGVDGGMSTPGSTTFRVGCGCGSANGSLLGLMLLALRPRRGRWRW